ncbi:unannotated protein [freshwater metagenome]|uniref:Unannotated protein n=1 Tax=freshwater metagenome TaxID=449393 RepID=A0A6J7CYQ5_9ZZZZ
MTDTLPRLLVLILIGGKSNSKLNCRRLGSNSSWIWRKTFSKSPAFLGLSSGFGEVAEKTISTNLSGVFPFKVFILGIRSFTCL